MRFSLVCYAVQLVVWNRNWELRTRVQSDINYKEC